MYFGYDVLAGAVVHLRPLAAQLLSVLAGAVVHLRPLAALLIPVLAVAVVHLRPLAALSISLRADVVAHPSEAVDPNSFNVTWRNVVGDERLGVLLCCCW